ncbi:MAG: DUF4367 domain-containing protein [Clostridiales bacterium]|nr:DUF4367 domain-containing protein [Clostridiales bacterium]
MLLEKETRELLEELEAEKAAGNTAEMDAFFARQDAKHCDLIHKYFRRQKIKNFFGKTLPKAAQIAAIFIAIVAVAGSVAIAASRTVRVHVLKLLTKAEPEYTSLHLVEDKHSSFDVPAEWTGDCYPAYIPDRFEILQVLCYPGIPGAEVTFTNRENGACELTYYENGLNSAMNIDTEGASLEEVEVNQYAATLIAEEDRHTIFWSDGRHIFHITTLHSSREEIIRIAESVTTIK